MAIYKLKDLYSEKPQYGASLAAQQVGKYRYVRQADIDAKVFNTFVDSGPFLHEGDVLISRAGAYAGKTYMHDSRENCVFAGFLVRYKFKQDFILNKYFFFWTKTNDYAKQMMQLRTGAVQPNFNPGSVGELVIDVPSIKIQQQIIDIIEPMENILTLIKKTMNLLEQLFENIYNYKNKKKIKLHEIAKITIGGTPSTKNKEYWGGDIPWINSGKLTNSFIPKSADKYITGLGTTKTKIANKNEILMSIMEPSTKKVSISDGMIAFNQSTASIKSDYNLFFEIKSAMNLFNLLKSGSAQQSINKTDIETAMINFASIEKGTFEDNMILLSNLWDAFNKMKEDVIKLLIK